MTNSNKLIARLRRAAVSAAVAGGIGLAALAVGAHHAHASHVVLDWVCHLHPGHWAWTVDGESAWVPPTQSCGWE